MSKGGSQHGTLEPEQELLAVRATAVASHASPAPDHRVARNDDRNGVAAKCLSGGAGTARLTRSTGNVLVGGNTPIGDLCGYRQHPPSESVDEPPIEWHLKAVAVAREVFTQFVPDSLQAGRILQDPWGDPLRQIVQHSRLVFEPDPQQAPGGGGDDQFTERRIDGGVGDVDHLPGLIHKAAGGGGGRNAKIPEVAEGGFQIVHFAMSSRRWVRPARTF